MSWNVKSRLVSWWRETVVPSSAIARSGEVAEDRAFVAAVEQRTRDGVMRLAVWMQLAFHLVSMPIDALVATPAISAFLLPTHLVSLVVLMLLLGLRARSLRVFRFGGAGMVFVAAATYSWVLHLSVSAERTLMPEAGAAHILILAGGLVVMPYRGRWLVIALAVELALTIAAVWAAPAVAAWLLVFAFALAVGLVISESVVRVALSGTLTNYRRLTKVAPPHLVRESTLTGRPFEEICAPASRRCVCISIGWVDYEMLASFLPPYAVEAELRLYYKYCTELLRGSLRSDAFYLDATVDEVFIVAFETPETSLDQTWARALSFVELLFEARRRRRPPFAAASLAVGISKGDAWVGMVGPEAYRKTTGLGEIPGRAARLRQIARLLGKARGLRDRLVVDPEDARIGSPAAAFPRLTLAPGAQVKDLEIAEVSYYEARVNWATPGMHHGEDAA